MTGRISLGIKTLYKKIDCKILNSIEKNFGDSIIDFVLITGSFGRYEATIKKIDEGYQLLNDIDILVIANEYNSNSIIAVQSELKKELNIPHFDIECISLKKLMKRNNTMLFYDLVHGSRFIYQRYKLPPLTFDYKKLPLSEFTKLIINRVVGFINSLYTINNRKFFYNEIQVSKLLISLGDYILFTKYNFYSASYYRRYKKFSDISNNNNLDKLILLGYKFKLEPNLIKVKNFDNFIYYFPDVINMFFKRIGVLNIDELARRDLNRFKDIFYSNVRRFLKLSFHMPCYKSNYMIVSDSLSELLSNKKFNKEKVKKLYKFWMEYCH